MLKEQQATHESQEQKPVGRPVDYAGRLASAKAVLEVADDELKIAEGRREHVREANRSLGESYHPFDMQTTRKRTAVVLRRELDAAFDTIEATLEDAELSENSLKKVAKARRMTEAMIDTLRFFWLFVRSQVKSLALAHEVEKVFREVLLPAVYFEIHAAKATSAEKRMQRKQQAERLYEQLANEHHWQALSQNRQQELRRAATDCAQIFQRSSSNVEGRNGQLSLHHHIYKTMNKRKLKAATVIHNYFIRRPDGTTAAERFFGNAPASLFGYLLSVTDYPAVPASMRSNARKLISAA